MKKKVKKIVLSLVAVAACAGAFGAYENYQQSGESNALLAENVEALNGDEQGSCHVVKCYSSLVYKAEVRVVDYSSCESVNVKRGGFHYFGRSR